MQLLHAFAPHAISRFGVNNKVKCLPSRGGQLPLVPSPLFTTRTRLDVMEKQRSDEDSFPPRKKIWTRFWRSFDTIERAGLSPDDVQFAGIFKRIKDLHNPKTYLVLALLAGLRWDWCFRNPYYWFGVAFCVKWYRARYVFKIPVWDRQPNWNNIITSKEQEKDLKAFTCKNCGSTLFIAKTREFFFEGNTGIGGLGCFACGAKGKDNFVMDRDRIVEDVADMDDYFEYERPLDFVSAAERRKLMKEAEGDEEKANQLLLERSGSATTEKEAIDVTSGDSSLATEEAVQSDLEENEEDGTDEVMGVETVDTEEETSDDLEVDLREESEVEADVAAEKSDADEPVTEAQTVDEVKEKDQVGAESESQQKRDPELEVEQPKLEKVKSTTSPSAAKSNSIDDEDIFDLLDMD